MVFGLLADRQLVDRRVLLASGIAFWSFATALGGYAQRHGEDPTAARTGWVGTSPICPGKAGEHPFSCDVEGGEYGGMLCPL